MTSNDVDSEDADEELVDDAECVLCARRGRMQRARCCGALMCSNAELYEPMSYSRGFCRRSHTRYTMCGFHHEQKHSKTHGWATCDTCVHGVVCPTGAHRANAVWRSTNGFNSAPPPPPRFLGDYAAVCDECKRPFLPDDGFSQNLRKDTVTCRRCAPYVPRFNVVTVGATGADLACRIARKLRADE